MRRALVLLILAAFAMTPARAQEQPTLHQALAELIHKAMPPATWSGPRNTWDAVSIRISSLMHWHLATPDDPGAESIKRNGWLSADGWQVGVTAYGEGDRVTSLGFERGDGSYGSEPAPDDQELLAALTARGVKVDIVERRDYPGEPPLPLSSIVYALSADGRESMRFTSSTHCTPPGSRAARRCWISHELALGD